MSPRHDTSGLEPITEEIRRPVTHARAPGMYRPAGRSSPRRRLFPRGWRDAMYAAWALAGMLLCAVLIAAGCEVLAILGRPG